MLEMGATASATSRVLGMGAKVSAISHILGMGATVSATFTCWRWVPQ